MEEPPKAPEPPGLERLIDDVQNLDTARMTLRWALERVQNLERTGQDLQRQLAEAQKTKDQQARRIEELEAASRQAAERLEHERRILATLEHFSKALPTGDLDLGELAREREKLRTLERSLLRESEARMAEVEKLRQDHLRAYAERAAELEQRAAEEAAKLRTGLDALRTALEHDFETRRASLDEDLLRRKADLEARRLALETEVERRLAQAGAEAARMASDAAAWALQARQDAEARAQGLETQFAARVAALESACKAREDALRSAEAAFEERKARFEEESRQAQGRLDARVQAAEGMASRIRAEEAERGHKLLEEARAENSRLLTMLAERSVDAAAARGQDVQALSRLKEALDERARALDAEASRSQAARAEAEAGIRRREAELDQRFEAFNRQVREKDLESARLREALLAAIEDYKKKGEAQDAS